MAQSKSHRPRLLLDRPDWVFFRSLEGLCQKSGVHLSELPKLLIKELVDNALDESGRCRFGPLEDRNGFFVEDDGPGFDGGAEELAELFSIRRAMRSSKLWRLPTRGTLGNGLRVVVGAVLATAGEIRLHNRGRRWLLKPQDHGHSECTDLGPASSDKTRLEVVLGPGCEVDASSFEWAHKAQRMALGDDYGGRPSPHWYSSDAFYDLCQAASELSLRELLKNFEGCAGKHAREICQGFARNDSARALSREDTDRILRRARDKARRFRPSRLGSIGPQGFIGDHYSCRRGTATLTDSRNALAAQVPIVVEVWTSRLKFSSELHLYVNKSPTTGVMHVFKDGSKVQLRGCGLSWEKRIPDLEPIGFSSVINVCSPHVPLTNDGKAPDLRAFAKVIVRALHDSLKRLGRAERSLRLAEKRQTKKDVVLSVLAEAAEKASDGGQFRYSQRQLFYVVRPLVQERLGAKLDYNYFTQILTQYESDYGRIPGMYRDPRGYLYHPHMRRRIPLGQQFIEHYQRPRWTFNKMIYIEKKGLLETLLSVDWPEQNDCAIIAAEGQATRADKDLFDLLGRSEEPITFFCVHDADAYGTMIYDRLQNETRARVARQVNIVNLGLDPWEALDMGLEWEPADHKRSAAVAPYVTDPYWRDWLQTKRVELNAMTPGQLIGWLNKKMAEHEGKVRPPKSILDERLKLQAAALLRQCLDTEMRWQARLGPRIEAQFQRMLPHLEHSFHCIQPRLLQTLESMMCGQPKVLWTQHIEHLAEELVAHARSDAQSIEVTVNELHESVREH